MPNPFEVARQISINEQKRVVQQYGNSIETSARRSATRANDELLEVTDKNIELIRENRALRAAQGAAMDLIILLADRSEAFRRVAHHLRTSWTPNDPSEAPLKTSIKPLFDQTIKSLSEDAAWLEERAGQIAKFVPASTGKKSTR